MSERTGVEKWRQPYTPNAASLRLTMEREGYRVFQWCDHPGTFYGAHLHAESQTHWVISGTIEIVMQGAAAYQLEPGDRDFVPANTRHTARVIGDLPVVYLVGEKLPEKKKRGRPKTIKEPDPIDELPWQLRMMLEVDD